MLYLLAAACFAIRALPRLVCPNAYGADTFYHLYFARAWRSHRFRLPSFDPRVVLPHEHVYLYPPGYHFLLALFPGRWRLWAERLTGALFDTLNLLIVYFYAVWLADHYGQPVYEDIAIWAAALYAFCPALLRNGWGPRAFNGSGRVLAQTLYLLHIVPGHFALTHGSLAAAGTSVVAGALLVLSSKFGLQVLAFFSLPLAVLVSPVFLLLSVASFVVSIVISRGHVLRIVAASFRHAQYYRRHQQRPFLHPHARNLKRYLRDVPGLVKQFVKGSIRRGVSRVFGERYWLHFLVFSNPCFIWALVGLRDFGSLDAIHQFLFAWLAAGLTCYFATGLKPLMFLGEAERYLEYAMLPAILLAMEQCIGNHWLLYWLAGYSLATACFFIYEFISLNRQADAEYAATEAVCKQLNQLPRGNVFPIGSSVRWQLLYRTSQPVVIHSGAIDERFLPGKEWLQLAGKAPLSFAEFSHLIEKYQARYIVTTRGSLDFYLRNIMTDPESFYQMAEPLNEEDSFLVFRVTDVHEHRTAA